MAQLQETGVKAEIQDLDSFMAGLKMMNLGLAEMGKSIAGASNAAKQGGEGFNLLDATMMGVVSGGAAAIGMAILNLVQSIGTNLVNAVQQASSAFTAFAQQGLMLAGRFNEMENSAIAVGRSYGVVDDATRAAIDTISDAGIRYDIASSTALQLIRNQIDLANATDLVAIAQATGIIIGADSSETMGRLTHAIATGNTAMLGYMGILVKREEIEREAQETFGTTVNLLSQQEKMQARVNAIIKASAPIMGVYASAMESPTKALRSLTGREIPTLGAVMMQTFIPAFKTGVDAVRGIVKAITAAMDEGGALYPVLVNLGAAASLVADGFKAAADFIAEWIKNLQINVSDGAAGTIELMARWGVEMIAVFAEAIVQAAAAYLTAAMRFVSSILTFWMAPGSPPRIAPEIDKWGAETINEWLHGMTKADFNILADIQSTIGKFLSGPELISATAKLTGFLAGERKLGEDFFRKIGEAAGFMGAEVIKLTKAQLALAQATEMIEMAERRLEESRRAVADAQDRTTALTKEYNQLLREGAPPEVLEAKLDEINASEEQIDLAQAQVREAEAAKEEVEGVLAPLKEQVELQKLLIAQLEKMAAQQEKLAAGAGGAAAAGGVGGAAGAAIGGLDIPALDPSLMGADITNRVSEAVETAKEALRAKLADIFAPVREAWANVQDDLDNVASAFNKFKDKVSGAWSRTWAFLQEQFQKFVTFWEENGERFQKIADAIFGKGGKGISNLLKANLKFAFGAAKDTVSYGIDAILLVLEGFASTLTGDWKNLWNVNVKFFNRTIEFIKGLFTKWLDSFLSIFGTNIDEFVSQWKENWEMAKTIVRTVITNVLTWIREKVTGFITAWTTFWNNVKITVSAKIAEIREAIVAWIRNLLEKMGIDLDDMKARWKKIFTDMKAVATTIWKKIVKIVKKVVSTIRGTITKKINEIRQWLHEKWTEIKENATTIWEDLKEAIATRARQIREKIQEIVNRIKHWWDKTWTKFKTKVEEIWGKIKDAISGSELYQKIKDSISETITKIKTWITNNIQRFKDIGTAIIEGLKEGVLETVGSLIESVTGSIEDALAAAKELLGIACPDPSPLFAELGIGIGEGLALGIRSMVPKIQSQMQLAVSPQAIGPVSMGSVAGGTTTNQTINMGGVIVQDAMTMNEFRFKIERTLLSNNR
jgi:phage-related protein